jgi:ferrous iron transport protein B
LVDLPGTYDIDAGSPDELVTTTALGGSSHPTLTVAMLDATALGRSLYLCARASASAGPMIAALTFTDVAASRGVCVDIAQLEKSLGMPVVTVNPRTGHGTDLLADAVWAALSAPPPPPAIPSDCVGAIDWADASSQAAAPAHAQSPRTLTDRVDSWLLRPWVGGPIFVAVLWALFQLTTVAAAPLMDAVDSLWTRPVSSAAAWLIPGDGWWQDLVVTGIMPGVGMTLTFVPLMALMFVVLALLEDSGYMARAAFIADRAMRAIGLDGNSIIPLVVGYGCNVPAIAALKAIPHAGQRLATALLIPFTSCTARLPVYILLSAAFFPEHAGTAVFAMYAASAVLIIVGSLAIRALSRSHTRSDPTVVVLPPYQRPQLRGIATAAWSRVSAFIRRAGTVIVAALAGLWLLAAIPVGTATWGNVPLESSLYGRAADSVAPVFAPAGFDDWRVVSALGAGFVAKEIVVASIAQSYALDEPANPGDAPDLWASLRTTFDESSGGHPGAAAAAFMIFILAYTPCVATMGELRRQFGLRWMAGSMGLSLSVAYVAAVTVFQVGSRL